MLSGRHWNFVGSLNQAIGPMPERFFYVWVGLHRCRSRLLLWMELRKLMSIVSRTTRGAILVRFLHLVEGLRLASNHYRGITDPSNTPGGNGHLIALRTLPRCATVAVPCCAHCGNGCPVSPHGHPPGVKNPTISPEGSKLSAQPRQSCSEGWFGRLSRNARKTSKAITRKFCGVW